MLTDLTILTVQTVRLTTYGCPLHDIMHVTENAENIQLFCINQQHKQTQSLQVTDRRIRTAR